MAQEHDQTTPTNAEHPARVDGKVGADGPIHSLPALPSPVDDNGMPLTLISPHDPARSRVSLLLSLRILKSCVLVVKVEVIATSFMTCR